MDEKRKGILRFFNLFDIAAIAVIVLLGAVLFLLGRNSAAPDTASAGTVTYVIAFEEMERGSDLIKAGDRLVDKIKKYDIGVVVSVKTETATKLDKDYVNGGRAEATLGTETRALVTVEAACTESDSAIVVGGGYDVKVGKEASVRGPGYFGTGYIVDIVREG